MKIARTIKIALTFTIALFFANQTQAQEVENYDQGFRLGFGVNVGAPTNEDVYNYALGADVRLQYDLTKRYSAVLSTGFTNLFISNNRPDLGFIPIKAGFKAFVWDDQFYVLGEVGGGIAVTNGQKQDTYLWSPGIGYASKKIDVSLRYESYTEYDTNQIALRIAYGFKL
ncbi:hypothetical protein SAMN05444396_10499 [Flavobacterium segetis]|uniref:Outer membrane protein beta-barrel domain-containing protein n=1 Tax=Flavobacterium segetis TaxID=271157 RepID=A0A1M5GR37_9FLAO|nr:hypothetical protein [Flavobacterium segetis]SHG06128.1 hypothetical protein SAMN05444396_10499 [Flavobacterium segetis]